MYNQRVYFIRAYFIKLILGAHVKPLTLNHLSFILRKVDKFIVCVVGDYLKFFVIFHLVKITC